MTTSGSGTAPPEMPQTRNGTSSATFSRSGSPRSGGRCRRPRGLPRPRRRSRRSCRRAGSCPPPPWPRRCRVRAHRDADVGVLAAPGASLTPSPVIATTSPSPRRAWARRSFCSGVDAGEDHVALGEPAASSCVGHALQLAAGDHVHVAAHEADAAGDGSAVTPLSPVTMITRMPAARQRRDGVGDLRPRRVVHADQAQELEVALDPVGVLAAPSGSERRARASTRRASRAIAVRAASPRPRARSPSVERGEDLLRGAL